jgi:hypothetical protein
VFSIEFLAAMEGRDGQRGRAEGAGRGGGQRGRAEGAGRGGGQRGRDGQDRARRLWQYVFGRSLGHGCIR